jgi:hypothetical protein
MARNQARARTPVISAAPPHSGRHGGLTLPAGVDIRDAWIWRTPLQVANDVRGWIDRLPFLSAVAGVPRSGVEIGIKIAQALQIPHLDLRTLTDSRPPSHRPLQHRYGPILVVDDTSWSGRTMNEVKKSTTGNVIFGTLYASEEQAANLDSVGYVLHTVMHTFPWNYLRDMHATWTLSDLDGVFCSDCPPEADDGAERYANWIMSRRCLIQPSWQPLEIITARPRTHREHTLTWLQAQGITSPLNQPFPTLAMQRAHNPADAKADRYNQRADAKLFVESDDRQARKIHELTRKPVLCTDTLTFYQ